jgi:hypothetical protein
MLRVGITARTALMNTVFVNSLRLPPATFAELTNGFPTTLMTGDAQRLVRRCRGGVCR